MSSVDSSVAEDDIPRGSNIELIKLRMPLFEVGKVLFTALIWSKSFRGFHNKPSALSVGISPGSNFTILDETSLIGNYLSISSYAFSEFAMPSCNCGRELQILFSFEKKWGLIHIFCYLQWIVYKIIFLWETWIQQGEKLSLLHKLLQLFRWDFQ